MEQIIILDPVNSKITTPNLRQIIYDELKYEKEYYKQTDKLNRYTQQAVKEQIVYTKSMLDKRNGDVLTGFVPRIIQKANELNLSTQVTDNTKPLMDSLRVLTPLVSGIQFTEEQKTILKTIGAKKRGCVVAPTAYGKSVLCMGVLSMFPRSRILVLCDSVTIIQQFYVTLAQHGFLNVHRFKTGQMWGKSDRIILSSIQSIAKVPPHFLLDFDITIIDEVHKFSNTYQTVMQQNLSSIRIGFTATFPTDKERQLMIEGLLGPIIENIKIEKAVDDNRIAKPLIKLVTVEPEPEITTKKKWTYSDIYEDRIINNAERNTSIINEIQKNVKNSLTTLTIVTQIFHGEILQKMCIAQGIDVIFAKGSTEETVRMDILNAIEKRLCKVVIATNIFREGINIKSLNSLILAGGGKGYIKVIQTVGRALRTSPGKDHGLIIDFLDTGKYLADHTIRRLNYYAQNKWDIITKD